MEFHDLLGQLLTKGKRADEKIIYICIYTYIFLVCIRCFVSCYLPELKRGMTLTFSVDFL